MERLFLISYVFGVCLKQEMKRLKMKCLGQIAAELKEVRFSVQVAVLGDSENDR